MSDHGFVTAAISYRLGLKGEKNIGPLNVKPLKNAIRMAVEDLYSATVFLAQNSLKYSIDPGKIILCGSSAGAVTVLQADYELANANAIASVLPGGFRYAGVIAFAGAILSFEGKPDYRKQTPAPTMFFHGTDDKVVFYNKMQLFNKGLFGTNALVKRFEKFNYPYYVYRYRDMGHEIAEVPMTRNVMEILAFINDYVMEKRPLRTDITIKDGELKPYMNIKSHKDLY
jgi:predicted esterase